MCYIWLFRRLTLVLILTALLTIIANNALALKLPDRPDNYVNDYTASISSNTLQQLNIRLKQFEDKTSNQIVVAIFPSLDDENLEDTTTTLEEQWKIGQKGKDNGILMVIFLKEHKIRIEVGYGLEAVVPDSLAGNIIANDIAPYFKKKDYDDGLINGINALISATSGQYNATNKIISADGINLYNLNGRIRNCVTAILHTFDVSYDPDEDIPPEFAIALFGIIGFIILLKSEAILGVILSIIVTILSIFNIKLLLAQKFNIKKKKVVRSLEVIRKILYYLAICCFIFSIWCCISNFLALGVALFFITFFCLPFIFPSNAPALKIQTPLLRTLLPHV